MLAPEFLPVWGGVGTYIVELVRHLPKTIEIHVVAPSRERLGSSQVKTSDYDFCDYFSDNVHVHLISSASDTFVYNAAFQYACLRFVPRLVREAGIDLIHSHTAHMPDLLLQLRRSGVPTVTTVHTTILGQRQASKASGMGFADLEFSEKATYLGYPILRFAERIYFWQAKPFITVSNWMKAQLLEDFPRLVPSNIRVIHNSVDTGFYRPGSEDDSKIVLFTGRLIAAKGLMFLVESIPRILRNHPEALFVFIGPGNHAPYESRLMELQVPKRSFVFLGYLKQQQSMLDYYRKCAVYVAPTLYENLPIRILEAMACAKPVVATDVCAIPEVITSHHNGILVKPKSSEALAEAISDLLKDPERRAQIGQRARQTVLERFDWTANAWRTAGLYEEVIAMS